MSSSSKTAVHSSGTRSRSASTKFPSAGFGASATSPRVVAPRSRRTRWRASKRLEQKPSTPSGGPRSLICVPLASSGKPLGALTLVTSDASSRRFTIADLSLAADLARRAAIVVEHARLFHEAQQATRARDDVLAVVAHDLRNPLNTVSMAVSLMLESTPPERVQERRQVEIVRRSANRMNRMIQDLLDVKRMESGRLGIEIRAEPPSAIINDTIDMLRPLASGSTIRLETNL